jgi:hypothetical protein
MCFWKFFCEFRYFFLDCRDVENSWNVPLKNIVVPTVSS